jgi:two-component system OmpR family sensor kinase
MKRIVLQNTLAVAVLVCAAVGVWLAIAREVAATEAAQERLAGELLDANVPVGVNLARTLMRPGILLLVTDRAKRITVAAAGGTVGVHRLEAPPGALEGPPDGGPPPPAPGEAEPPGPRQGLLPPRPFDALVFWLVHTPPVVVARGDRVVRIAPDVHALEWWLALEILGFACATLAVGVDGTTRVLAGGRAERRQLEARIAERREAAERYQRFLAETGHELRTPLTVLTGYIDILRGRAPDEPLDDRILEGMHAEAARMRVLVEKMMTLARLEADIGIPRLLDVATAAREAAQTLRRRHPERDVRVEAAQTAVIVIDADDYAVALGNVLENAVKYAPGSPIEIATSVRDGRVTTAVVDHGPGIHPQDQPAIFERFYRGRGRALGEGLGLGLAIAKRIADRWDGTVDCESGRGRTVFRLSFPLAAEEPYGLAR